MNSTVLVRLIEANQRAGKQVSIVDRMCLPGSPDAIAGGVCIERGNKYHKMTVGSQQYYVNDIVNLVEKSSLVVKVD